MALTPALTAVLLSSFTPAKLPGLSMWLAADRLALNDGDPVASWTDLSGNNNHATQSTGAAKPLYKTGIANGRPGVLFDGVDDFMSLPLGIRTALIAGDKTVFVAAQWVVVTISTRALAAANGAGSNRFCLQSGSSSRWNLLYTTGTAATNFDLTAPAPAASTTGVTIAEAVQSGATITGRVNGSQGGQAVDAGVEASSANAAIGSNANGSGSFGNLYIMEVIAYNVGLSAADAARVRRYLGSRWGVAVS